MKTRILYFIFFIFILLNSCKKDNSKLVNMSNKEFIKFIATTEDFTKGIARIDSILATNQSFDIHKTGLLYYTKASYLFEYSEYIKAIAFANKGLPLFEKENHKTNIAVSYNLLGKANMYLEKYAIAEEQLNKAYAIFKEKKDIRNQIPALQSLGYVQYQKNDLKKAILLLEETIELGTAIKDTVTLSKSYNNLGYINGLIDNTGESIKNYKKAIAINKQSKRLYSSPLTNLGDLYFSENKLEESVKLYEQALTFERKKNNLQKQKEIYSFLLDTIKKPEFIYLRSLYVHQKDSINNLIVQRKNEKKIKEVENQYKLVSKESELKRQKNSKKYILIGFLIILIPIIGLLYMYYQKIQSQSELNKVQEEVKQKEIETLLKDQELNLIKASIKGQKDASKRIAQELHDSIGGNLASIKLQLSNAEIDEKNHNTLSNQIDDTYNQVRNLSHNLIPKKFNENVFSSLVETYLKNIQKGSDVAITFNIHPKKDVNAIDDRFKVTLYKIIQELLTNTLKHANASQIDIHINKYDDYLKLLFEDNGIGFNPKKKKDGIGFSNIKNRLEKVSGTIHIDTFIGRGTIIDIDIPT